MSNQNAPFGLMPLGLNAAPSTPAFSLDNSRKIANGNTKVIGKGDPLINLNTGYVDRISGTPDTTVASQYCGIFWGCSYTSVALGRRVTVPYYPGGDATGDIDVQMIPLIGVTPGLFLIQTLLTPVAFADIGQNGQFSYAAGTAFSGFFRSGVTLDTTLNTTATFPLRIKGLYSQISARGAPGTDDTANYNIAIVQFNAMQETGI